MVRILSWNVNGLRALLGKRRLRELLDELGADIVCVQETKTTSEFQVVRCAIIRINTQFDHNHLESQLDYSGVIADGYNSYFSFCKSKTGYSGTEA